MAQNESAYIKNKNYNFFIKTLDNYHLVSYNKVKVKKYQKGNNNERTWTKRSANLKGKEPVVHEQMHREVSR